MPKFSKYLQEIEACKNEIRQRKKRELTKEYNSEIRSRLPKKLEDPGSFILPIQISESDVGLALCELGPSINLMPLFVLKGLGLGKQGHISIRLLWVNMLHLAPDGIIEDALVWFGMLIIPTYLIIMYFETDARILFIQGCPTLTTKGALIDVKEM